MPIPPADAALQREYLNALDTLIAHSWVVTGRFKELIQAARGVIADDDGIVTERLQAKLPTAAKP